MRNEKKENGESRKTNGGKQFLWKNEIDEKNKDRRERQEERIKCRGKGFSDFPLRKRSDKTNRERAFSLQEDGAEKVHKSEQRMRKNYRTNKVHT